MGGDIIEGRASSHGGFPTSTKLQGVDAGRDDIAVGSTRRAGGGGVGRAGIYIVVLNIDTHSSFAGRGTGKEEGTRRR